MIDRETVWRKSTGTLLSIYLCLFMTITAALATRTMWKEYWFQNQQWSMRIKKEEFAFRGIFFPSTYLELCLVPIRATSHSDNGPLPELTLSFYGYFMLNHVQWSFAPGPFLWCPDKTLTTFLRMLCLLICLSLSLSSIVILLCVRPWSAELNLTSSSLPDQLLLLEEASRGSGLR